MKKIYNRFLRYIKRIFRIIERPEMRVLPGQIAFFMVLSLIPLVTVIGLIASQFSIPLSNLVAAVTNNLPKEIGDIIIPILSSPGKVSIYSIVLGFCLASNAAYSIIIASNMLFKIDDSNFIRRRIKALVMLILLVLLLLFMIVVLGFGNTIFNLILNYLDLNLPSFTYYIFFLAKWTIGISIIFMMVKLLLTFAPDHDILSKNMNRGSLFITVTWVVATILYSLFVNNFANYNVFYSSLANIVVLMVWMYIISYTLVVGIAINGENYLHEKKEEESSEKERVSV